MNSDTRPTLWKRLFLFFIRMLIASLILIALVWGGYLGVMELQRSFNSVATRIELNRREIASLRDEVGVLSAAGADRQQTIATLQTEAAGVEGRLNDLRTEISADLTEQQQQLAMMEENVATAATMSEAASQTASEETASLSAAIAALQGDLNETNGHIDALGGEIDALRADNELLNDNMGDLRAEVEFAAQTAADIEEMQQTMALFHVWELVTRARLRLAEANVGSATADVERAFRAVDALLSTESVPEEEALQVMLTRLALAFSNLPDNADVAARDLESAWDALDDLLTERLLPDLASSSAEELTLPALEEATPEPTAEPTVEPTPAPSS